MRRLYTLSVETQGKYGQTRINPSSYTMFVFYIPIVVTIIALHKPKILTKNIQFTCVVSPNLFWCGHCVTRVSIYPKLEWLKMHDLG